MKRLWCAFMRWCEEFTVAPGPMPREHFCSVCVVAMMRDDLQKIEESNTIEYARSIAQSSLADLKKSGVA